MQNLMLAMLGGAQIIYEASGVLDNIMTTSYEKRIIDEELYKRVSRICRGMDTPALELLKDTGLFVENDEALAIFDGGGCRVDGNHKVVKLK